VIASNWIEAYQKYVHKTPPTPVVHETKTAPATTANEVWVNTRSGKYCAAAEANEYSPFVRVAALRIFFSDPGETLASVKRAEELADELEEQGYFHIYCSEDVDLLD
jgi:hypothetical protein